MSIRPAASSRSSMMGPYELVERLGAGGMAEVWSAREPGSRRLVAIKRVLPHLVAVPEVVSLFLAEARTASRFRHPNIVETFDAGIVDGRPFLVMEHLDGTDLGVALRVAAPPHGVCLYIARAIARALVHVHAYADAGSHLGLVHRDVSLANIRIGEDGSVRLLDFGIAKALNDAEGARTRTGVLRGKLAYVAPEQLEGRAASAASDQYALGVVLHELLTARRLFPDDGTLEQGLAARRDSIRPPLGDEHAALNAICLRALAFDPIARFPNVAAMEHAMEPWLTATGVTRDHVAAWVAPALQRAPPVGETPPTLTDAAAARPVRATRWRYALGAIVLATGALGWLALRHRSSETEDAPAPFVHHDLSVAPPAVTTRQPSEPAPAPAPPRPLKRRPRPPVSDHAFDERFP